MGKSKSKILGEAFSDDIEYREGEVASGNTIYPGMVIEETGNVSGPGTRKTVRPINTIEKLGESLTVALTPTSPPKGSDADIPIEHEYSAGEHIQYAIVYPGATVQNAILASGDNLATASEANISFDADLATNDDGGLKESTTAGAAIARALEAVDNSGGSDQGGISGARIEIEAI